MDFEALLAILQFERKVEMEDNMVKFMTKRLDRESKDPIEEAKRIMEMDPTIDLERALDLAKKLCA